MRWHHDVSTDPSHPPLFVALRETRMACRNGAEYSGLSAAEHRAHYADLRTAIYPQTPALIFQAAHTAAHTLRWQLTAAALADGRIEATATTPLLHFKDDVVIRIRAHADGAQLDIRSASRIGQSDLGANAKRIRRFLQETNNYLKTNT